MTERVREGKEREKESAREKRKLYSRHLHIFDSFVCEIVASLK